MLKDAGKSSDADTVLQRPHCTSLAECSAADTDQLATMLTNLVAQFHLYSQPQTSGFHAELGLVLQFRFGYPRKAAVCQLFDHFPPVYRVLYPLTNLVAQLHLYSQLQTSGFRAELGLVLQFRLGYPRKAAVCQLFDHFRPVYRVLCPRTRLRKAVLGIC